MSKFLAWLDSLAVVYPDEVECRKEALRMSREIRMSGAVKTRSYMWYEWSSWCTTPIASFLFEVISVPDMPDEKVRYRGYQLF